MKNELAYAARRARRSFGFSALAVLTLAVGIGVNSAMYALLDGVLFRPPANVYDADGIVRIAFSSPQSSDTSASTDYPTFDAIRRSSGFAGAAAWANVTVSFGANSAAEVARASIVSVNFFHLLGARPLAGRFFTIAKEPLAEVVLSYGFWKQRFGGRNVLGMTVPIDGRTYVVVGILPAQSLSLEQQQADLWLPLELAAGSSTVPPNWRTNLGSYWIGIVARLRGRVSLRSAEQQATAAVRNAGLSVNGDRDERAVIASSLVPGRGAARPKEARVSLWLTGVSTLVLLIACANLTELLLVRNIARRRDYLIKMAVGAAPSDIAISILADIVIVVLVGTLVALVLNAALRQIITGFISDQVPFATTLFDPRNVVLLVATALIAFVIVAVITLTHAHATGLIAGAGLARPETDAPRRGARRGLLISQSALSVALLFVALLFAKSLRRVRGLDLGLQPDQTIQLRIQMNPGGRSDAEVRAIYDNALVALRNDPRVVSAAVAEGSPYQSGTGTGPFTDQRSREELWTGHESAYWSSVGDHFFTTVGATSLQGRDFDERDRIGAARVAIINEPLARYLWPGASALGKCLHLGAAGDCVRVVGVLAGVWKFSILERNKMALYTPMAQSGGARPGSIFIRPRGDARDFLTEARTIVQAANPRLPAVRVSLVRDIIAPEIRPWRFGAEIFSGFSALALLIAAVGLYAVVSLGVALRAKEIGIRLALGAPRRHIVGVAAREALTDVAVGLAIGAFLVFAASRWLSGVLFETSPADASALVSTFGILFAFSVAAIAWPVARALRTDIAAILQSS